MWIYLLLFTAGLVFLLKGAETVTEYASRIAKKLGVSELVIGITLVAMATSLPELAVSLLSAFTNAEIATGTIIGSNISNIFLILGASALLTPMVTGREFLKQEYAVLLFSIVLAVFLLANMEWYKGIILIAMFIVYMHYILKKRRMPRLKIRNPLAKKKSIPKDFAISIIGALFVILGAKLLVDSTIKIAQWAGISEIVIALTVIAVGTSLPELATSLMAAYKKMRGIAIGNIIGSNIFNITILGMASLIRTVPTTTEIILINLPIMLFATVLLMLAIKFQGRLSRPLGAIFIVLFIVFIALQAVSLG